MTAIFYFIGFVLSVLIFSGLIRYPKIINIRKHYNIYNDKDSKLETIIRSDDMDSYIHMITYALTILSFMLWIFIGLLSNNAPIFFIFLLGYFVTSKLISFIGDKKSTNVIKTSLYMFLSLLTSIGCLFISLNHFYFKYDLVLIMNNFFNIN